MGVVNNQFVFSSVRKICRVNFASNKVLNLVMISAVLLSLANVFSVVGMGLVLLSFLRLFSYFSSLERIALAIPLGIGTYGWILFMLGLFGNITTEACILIIFTGILGFLYLCPKIKFSGTLSLSATGYLFLGIISYIFVLDFFEALTPPADGDTLAYHFSIPKIISETGKVIFTPRIIDGAVPLLIQMTYVPILLLGGEFALSMWVFLTGWCLAFMLFVVARRYLSLNWSLCLVIILTTTPIVVGASGSGQVEIRLGLFVVGSSFAMMFAVKRDDLAFFILAGILAGFSAASKYYGLLFILACGVIVFGGKNWLKNGSIYGVFALIAGFQWYYWNWFHTGDPFFPVLYDFLGHQESVYWTQEHNAESAKFFKKDLGVPVNLFWLFYYPIKATVDGMPQFDSLRLGLGLYPLLVLPFAIAGIIKFRKLLFSHELLIFAIISIVFYCLWFFSETSQRIRHLLPILPLVLVCFTVASNKFVNSINLSNLISFGVALVMIFQIIIQSVFSVKIVTHVFGKETREAYLERTVSWYEPVKWINTNLASSNKILSEMRWYSYLLKPSHYYGHPYYQSQVNLLPQKIDVREFIKQVQILNITHIIPWPNFSGSYNSALDIYTSKLKSWGCLKTLKNFQLKPYISSRTFWKNNGPSPGSIVLYELRLRECVIGSRNNVGSE